MAIRTDIANNRSISNDIAKQDDERFRYAEHKNPFNQAPRDNYQTYPYDYYSGSDCKIFFGDVWVDDIITIQYAVSQNKLPIYGYASQTYDAIARGQVTVEGMLTVAFKETGYLNVIQYLIDAQREKVKGAVYNVSNEYGKKAKDGTIQYNPRLMTNRSGSTNFGANSIPSIIRQEQTIEHILNGKEKNKISTELWSKVFGGDHRQPDFEDFAESLEDAIWGDANGHPYNPKKSILRRADEFDYIFDSAGNDTGGIRVGKNNINGQDDYSQCLNILLTFGDINDFRAEHTLIALNDIHFTSVNMIVSPSGEPIAESYTFFARDLNRSIQDSKNIFNINPIKFNIGSNKDFVASKIDELESILSRINDEDGSKVFYQIFGISRFYNGKWEDWVAGNKDGVGIQDSALDPNSYTPLSDQMIERVEKDINARIDTFYIEKTPQIIINLKMGSIKGDFTNIRMVLEQQIPDTKTYRVIAPTRSTFSAQTVITRDDIWSMSGISNSPAPKTDGPSPEAPKQKDTPIDNQPNNIPISDKVIEVGIDQNELLSVEDSQKIRQNAIDESNKIEQIKSPEILSPINDISKVITTPIDSHTQKYITEQDAKQRLQQIYNSTSGFDAEAIANKHGVNIHTIYKTMALEGAINSSEHKKVKGYEHALAFSSGLTAASIIDLAQRDSEVRKRFNLTKEDVSFKYIAWDKMTDEQKNTRTQLDKKVYNNYINNNINDDKRFLFETITKITKVNQTRAKRDLQESSYLYPTGSDLPQGHIYARYVTGNNLTDRNAYKAAFKNFENIDEHYNKAYSEIWRDGNNTQGFDIHKYNVESNTKLLEQKPIIKLPNQEVKFVQVPSNNNNNNNNTFIDNFINRVYENVIVKTVDTIDKDLAKKVSEVKVEPIINNLVGPSLDSINLSIKKDINIKTDNLQATADSTSKFSFWWNSLLK